PDTTIPEFKATIEYLETQPASVMDPNVVRLPHLNVFQAALKQLPSLKNNVSTALVDELCQRFVAFTTKSCCAGLALPAADSFPFVNEEHRQLLACRERILGACSPTDVQKASEIMRFASSRHKAHYDRVTGKWDNALFRFVVCGFLRERGRREAYDFLFGCTHLIRMLANLCDDDDLIKFYLALEVTRAANKPIWDTLYQEALQF
ncbi:hypothetical protein HDU98_004116, partial [Podochytrium sp. JEL0797]